MLDGVQQNRFLCYLATSFTRRVSCLITQTVGTAQQGNLGRGYTQEDMQGTVCPCSKSEESGTRFVAECELLQRRKEITTKTDGCDVGKLDTLAHEIPYQRELTAPLRISAPERYYPVKNERHAGVNHSPPIPNTNAKKIQDRCKRSPFHFFEVNELFLNHSETAKG